MKITLLATLATLLLVGGRNVGLAQDAAVPADKKPEFQVSEVTKTKIQLAIAKREIALRKFIEAKTNYEKLAKDLQTEYKGYDEQIKHLTELAYRQAQKDQAKFDYDPDSGTFTEKASTAPEKPSESEVK